MGYNSACIRDFCKIFAPIGWFSGMGRRMLQLHFSPTDPRCHGNEIWDKIGYNSDCIRDFCKIFAPIGGMGHRMLTIAFFLDRPPLPWQRNLWQNGLWFGLRRRFLRYFCTYRGVFGDGPSNAANCIFSRPTPVAMAKKFGTKLAITRLA